MNPILVTGSLAVAAASAGMLVSFSADQAEYSRSLETASSMQSERLREQLSVERGPGGVSVRNTGTVPVTILEVRDRGRRGAGDLPGSGPPEDTGGAVGAAAMIPPVGRACLARNAPPGGAAGAAALMLLLAALPACADTVHVVTERGNVFSSGDGGEAGSSALDGLGISSRLVHHAERGTLVHASSGSGLSGTEVSLRPYVRVPADAPFAFLASEAEALPVPRFYRSYSISDGSLSAPSPAPNVLGYSASRALSGSVQAERQGGIAVSGEGRLVLKLEPHGGPVVISGELSEGTTARLATSPYDLAALPYELSRGFPHLFVRPAIRARPSISAEAGSVPGFGKERPRWSTTAR